MHIMLTHNGQECADEYECDVAAYLAAQRGQAATLATQYTQNFHGSVHGQVAQGAQTHQVQNTRLNPAALLDLMRTIRAAAADAPAKETEPVLAVVQQVEDEVRAADPDPGWIRSLLDRGRTLGRKAATTSFTTAVGGATTKALDMLQQARHA